MKLVTNEVWQKDLHFEKFMLGLEVICEKATKPVAILSKLSDEIERAIPKVANILKRGSEDRSGL